MMPAAARAAALFAALPLALFGPFWLRGLGSFWGDLFYIHRPWRVFDAQCLQAGRLPLWNPHLYFGMPAAASMQDGLYYPPTILFHVFPFPAALALYQLAHYWLAGFAAYLCLRRHGARHGASLAGALPYALGGVLVADQGFLNHLAVLALWPAALALVSSPRACALALALMFFAGYPPYWLGTAGAALAAAWAARGARRGWGAAAGIGALTAALSAVLLIPGAELVANSRRSGGVGLEEALRFGFAPADLLNWANPLLAPGAFDPAIEWWKGCYLGLSGAALALLGLAALPRRRALFVALAAAFVLALTLAGSAGWSTALWRALPPLKLVRYPGNLSYLALPLFCAAAAAGLARAPRRARAALLALMAAELLALGWLGFKAAPASLWSRRGPLVRALQESLGDARYLLSPRALETHAGAGLFDWADRLYGLTNAPYRLRAAGNFGEPLVPRENYALMDRLYSSGPAAAAELMPGANIGALLAPDRIAGAPALRFEGDVLWGVHRVVPRGPRAAWLPRESGAPAPLTVSTWGREDRFVVAARTKAGWARLAEPLFPGWKVYLETELGPGLAVALPDGGPFQKVAVPSGAWTLTWLYAPASFTAGLWATLLALAWLSLSSLRALKRTP